MKNIVIFASGSGTNAQNICEHFKSDPAIKVAALFCNKPGAGVIERMKAFHVPVHVFSRTEFKEEHTFLSLLDPYQPDLIVLAGFLWLIPDFLVKKYPGKIINIHPALLPRFGGKGMYGHHVHEAVLLAKEKEHGITIHFVNEKYDEGQPVFQAKFDVKPGATLDDIQKSISALEMQYFPEAIKRVLS
ncbi:MAG: phosphoribosylglycinamide formyltransferase [Bacteroidota bacterium]